jgi:hypothetical protein
MLSLDSPRWQELEHAYGRAVDTPALLLQLRKFPKSNDDAEPWFSLWSSLAHQGDVHSASFAAVSHVVAALASDPLRCDWTYFQFPAWIEICRVKKGAPIPSDLEEAYFEALRALPGLAAKWAEKPWADSDLACVLSAIAAAKGHAAIAEAAMELTDTNAAGALEWFVDH